MMVQLNICLSKIKYNALILQHIFDKRDIHLTPVIKSIAGDIQIVNALMEVGMTHFADSRIDNIKNLNIKNASFMLLRPTEKSELEDLLHYTKMSIQTEISTIRDINQLAASLNKTHQVLLMIDWKDGREGILTYDLIEYIHEIMNMKHIKIIGVAFNFMCFQSSAPSENDIFDINRYICAAEKEMGFKFKLVSGGNSSMIPQLMYNDLGKINELRIGESLFRGVNTTNNNEISCLYQDAITLEAEIIEIKPRIDINSQQPFLQAIVNIGYVDTMIDDIEPVDNNLAILGGSSDHLMLDLNNSDCYKLGDKIEFKLGYKALAHSMYLPHLKKNYLLDNQVETLLKGINQHHCITNDV